jgi:hypothetical protein
MPGPEPLLRSGHRFAQVGLREVPLGDVAKPAASGLLRTVV